MAKAELKKEMKRLNKAVDDAFARGVLDSARQLVTITKANLVESYIEGYELLKKKHKNNPKAKLPIIQRRSFVGAVNRAFPGIIQKIGAKKRSGHEIVEVGSDYFVFAQNKGLNDSAFTIIKQPLVDFVRQKVEKKGGKLTGAKEEAEILFNTNDPTGLQISAASGRSDVGVLKRGGEREHAGKTTVGAARLVAAMQWMKTDKYFKQYTGMKMAKSFAEKYGELEAVFDTKGTKKGSLQLKVKEDVQVFLGPGSKNYPGSQVNDWDSDGNKQGLRDKLLNTMVKHLQKQKLEDFKGSPSITDNAETAVAYELMRSFKQGKNVRVTGPKTKNTSRPKNRAVASSSSKRGPSKKKSAPKAAIATIAATRGAGGKSPRSSRLSSPINLFAILNNKINKTVIKNMGAPRLENQTGTFANSVRITDISATPQGFPSVGYTYQRRPYGVFESSSGSRFSSVERDPRTLIDASIREIAAQLVEGRIYTRRQ